MSDDGFLAGGGRVAVAVHAPGDLVADLRRTFADLLVHPHRAEVVGRLDVRRDGERVALLLDGNPVHSTRPTLAVPAVGWLLTRVLGRSDRHVAVHAAAFVHPEGAVVAVGGSSAGKSTLAAAGVLDGAALLSDELALFDPADPLGPVAAYPRPIGLRPGGVEVLGAWRPAIAGRLPAADADGTRRVRPVDLGGQVADATPCRAVVVLPPRPHDEGVVTRTLSPAASTAALALHAPGDRRAALPTLAAVAARVPAWVVVADDLVATLDSVRALLAESGPTVDHDVLLDGTATAVRVGDEGVAATPDGDVHLLNAAAVQVLVDRRDGRSVGAHADRTLAHLRGLGIVVPDEGLGSRARARGRGTVDPSRTAIDAGRREGWCRMTPSTGDDDGCCEPE